MGISALYCVTRARRICFATSARRALGRYIAVAEEALADRGDAWEAFAGFMRRAVDADTHSLTLRLAGTFTPTEELNREGARAHDLTRRLLDRTSSAGALRPGIEVGDLSLIFEQLAAVRVGDRRRTNQLRHRYLALMLDALHAPGD